MVCLALWEFARAGSEGSTLGNLRWRLLTLGHVRGIAVTCQGDFIVFLATVGREATKRQCYWPEFTRPLRQAASAWGRPMTYPPVNPSSELDYIPRKKKVTLALFVPCGRKQWSCESQQRLGRHDHRALFSHPSSADKKRTGRPHRHAVMTQKSHDGDAWIHRPALKTLKLRSGGEEPAGKVAQSSRLASRSGTSRTDPRVHESRESILGITEE